MSQASTITIQRRRVLGGFRVWLGQREITRMVKGISYDLLGYGRTTITFRSWVCEDDIVDFHLQTADVEIVPPRPKTSLRITFLND